MSVQIFNKPQYSGVHNVKIEPVRVLIDGVFSLSIPTGFSYILDAEHTAKDFAHNGLHYLMQAQAGYDNDFSLPYATDVNLVIFDLHNTVSADNLNLTDARMDDYIRNANVSIAAGEHNIQEIFREDRCAVYACMCDADENFCKCRFQVFVAGCNKTYLGEILISGKTPEEYGLIVIGLLRSISSETDFSCDSVNGWMQLSYRLRPDFSGGTLIKAPSGLELDIPGQYKGSCDQNEINPCYQLQVIPEFDNYSAPGEANTLSFSVNAEFQNVAYRRDRLDEILNSMSSDSAEFSSCAPWYTAQCDDEYAVVFQIVPSASRICSHVLICTGTGLYTAVCEYCPQDSDNSYASRITAIRDLLMISYMWFRRIRNAVEVPSIDEKESVAEVEIPQTEEPVIPEIPAEPEVEAPQIEEPVIPEVSPEPEVDALQIEEPVIPEVSPELEVEAPQIEEPVIPEVPAEIEESFVSEASAEPAESFTSEASAEPSESFTTEENDASMEDLKPLPEPEDPEFNWGLTPVETKPIEDITFDWNTGAQLVSETVAGEVLSAASEKAEADAAEIEESIAETVNTKESEATLIESEEAAAETAETETVAPEVNEPDAASSEVSSEDYSVTIEEFEPFPEKIEPIAMSFSEVDTEPEESASEEAAPEEIVAIEEPEAEEPEAEEPEKVDIAAIASVAESTVGETTAQPSPEVFAYYSALEEKSTRYDGIREFFSFGEAGYANEHFRADKSLLFLHPGEKAETLLYCNYGLPANCSFVISGNSATGAWNGGWIGSSIKFCVTAQAVGTSVFTFTNNLNDDAFSILVIVE